MAALDRAAAGAGLHCWAMTRGSLAKFTKMAPGDVVLFSQKASGKFNYLAHVIFKVESEALGRAVWSFVPGEPWRLIYFVEGVEGVDIDKVQLVTELGYDRNYVVPGVVCVPPVRLDPIIDRYGTVTAFLHAPSTGDLKPAEPRQTAPEPPSRVFSPPGWARTLASSIERLKADQDHQERAHESLVEEFYRAIGYAPFVDVKHRQGRIDISVEANGAIRIVNEVKRDWGLTRQNVKAVDQAYRYANHSGARFVVITNGNCFAVFDRDKGRSIAENFVADFTLTNLRSEDLEVIELLQKGS
jgi:hypothetical protein